MEKAKKQELYPKLKGAMSVLQRKSGKEHMTAGETSEASKDLPKEREALREF